MKRNFIILFFVSSCLFSATGCRRADAPSENANAANQNADATTGAATPTPNANAAETAIKLPTEVPTFTDADEAVAMGDKYLDAVETENAINAYRQATKLNPDFADAFFKLGIAYSLREKEEKDAPQSTNAEAEPTPTPKKPAKKTKKNAPAAPVTDAEKAFDSAAKAYEKILKKNPKDEQAQYNLGRAFNKLNRDNEAEKALRLAVKLKPEEAEFQTELGSILIKLAQYDEAVTILAKAVKLDENNLHAQDLLERANAGKKRINFGIKPKLPTQQQQQQLPEIISQPKPNRPKPKPTAAAPPAVTPPSAVTKATPND